MNKKIPTVKNFAAENRKARFDYEILSTIEAGIMLTGTEIKSLRLGKASIGDSYASRESGGFWLINCYIPEYLQANRFNHEPRRRRKLLLHSKEIDKLGHAIERDGMTIVPLNIHYSDKGLAKVELGVARGKKLHDKRESEKARDWSREKGRLLRDRG
jgi:SsrA-binding protein